MVGRIILFAGLFGIALSGGCTPYIEGIRYAPHPAVAEVRAVTTSTTQPSPGMQPGMQSPLTSFATVIGIRREDSKLRLPLSVEVRLRFDHRGPQAVTFDPNTLDLTNGDLARFLPPIIQPPQVISVPSGQSVAVEAYFPFPPETPVDGRGMETLQLHWAVQIDGHTVPQVVTFHRIRQYYYDPWDPWWGYPPYSSWSPDYGIGGAIIVR